MSKKKGYSVIVITILLIIGVTYVDFYGVDGQGAGSASTIKLGLDLAGGVSITYEVVGDEEINATDLSDTIEKLKQRVQQYSTESLVYQEGNNRINIEIPGVSNAEEVLKELGKPGSLYFLSQTNAEGIQNYSYQIVEGEGGYTLNRPIEELLADGSVALFGTDVKDAQALSYQNQEQGKNEFVVSLKMTDEGTQKFADLTEKAAKSGESIAIYYDGELVSVAGVAQALTTGDAVISGNMSFEEVEQLASTIRIGGLRLQLQEIYSKVVGAQLGSEAIATSLLAGVIGLILIILFMLIVYRVSGVASTLALAVYASLIVLLLRGFDLTLTLSGIAGIILSIGMAVDANVIIFARIREEITQGKSVEVAMKIGFNKAFSAIIDGNLTTMIAAIVLITLCSGSIKGFGQTLILGIGLSMFTALVVTKYVLHAFYAIGIQDAKWYGVGKEVKCIDFMKKRRLCFSLSIVAIAIGILMMGINIQIREEQDGLNYSMDFKGGTSISVTMPEEYTLARLEEQVIPLIQETIGGGSVQVQNVQGSHDVIFKTNTLQPEQREALQQLFMEEFGVGNEHFATESISATISAETKNETIVAVIVAIVLMLLYIRIRFKDFRFGVSSVVALIHDIMIVVAFYAFAWISVGNTFMACILTIVGYSINATIVIFDRIRENKAQMEEGDSLENMVNHSISQTLSRSIFTSFTTFIMVTILYILGVSAIREFALPLMVGIICGTYSSIFLTGALWYWLTLKFPPKEEVE